MKKLLLKTLVSTLVTSSLFASSLVFATTPKVTKAPNETKAEQKTLKKSNAGEVKDLKSFLIDGKATILLLGIDGPTDSGQRSDTVMMCQIDTNKKDIKIISMPRDSYVDIPGEGNDKLTHAFAYGGANLTLDTLKSNFDIPLQGYMTLNFTTFPKLVDEIGGVEIELSPEEDEIATGVAEGGLKTLNGKQALAFGRIRKIDSDFMRTGRHRRLMSAIIKKIKQKDVKELPNLAGTLYEFLDSNIPMELLLELGTQAYEGDYKVKDTLIPNEENSFGDYTEGGAWILNFDKAKAKAAMHDFLNK